MYTYPNAPLPIGLSSTREYYNSARTFISSSFKTTGKSAFSVYISTVSVCFLFLDKILHYFEKKIMGNTNQFLL